MTDRRNILLAHIANEFGDSRVKAGDGEAQIDHIVLTKGGHLRIALSNGHFQTIKNAAPYLNERNLAAAHKVVRELKSRGLISGVFTFIRLIAFLTFVVFIASIVLIVLGVRALVRNNRTQQTRKATTSVSDWMRG